MLLTGTRDALLGDTATLPRAMIRAGVNARPVVFDALPHTFWYHFEFPQTKEALQVMARFFDQNVVH